MERGHVAVHRLMILLHSVMSDQGALRPHPNMGSTASTCQ